jgi:hypothetical protein
MWRTLFWLQDIGAASPYGRRHWNFLKEERKPSRQRDVMVRRTSKAPGDARGRADLGHEGDENARSLPLFSMATILVCRRVLSKVHFIFFAFSIISESLEPTRHLVGTSRSVWKRDGRKIKFSPSFILQSTGTPGFYIGPEFLDNFFIVSVSCDLEVLSCLF